MTQITLAGVEQDALRVLEAKVIEVARGLFENQLVVSTFGVVSVRIPNTNLVLITPSGFSKARLSAENLIVVDFKSNLVQGKFRPSVETPMHTYIHANRPDVSTVVHTHSPIACAFAAACMEIPCVIAEQAFYLGGRVPLVRRYSLPGTNRPAELAAILRALQDCNAVLLRKHGAVIVGKTPEECLDTAIVLEHVATVALHSIMLARPKELTRREINLLRTFKKTKYGQTTEAQ